tara:strand:+ start:282 stop:422 length:141 start_codon:yes stop_codon:yes gene_type:complete
MLRIYLWIMGWSGKINTWAWHKQANIIKNKQYKENEEYLKELKDKL